VSIKVYFNEDDENIIKKAEKIVGSNDKEYYTLEDLVNIIDNLTYEFNLLEEKIEDREQDIEDNYKRIDVASQYDVNENMFH